MALLERLKGCLPFGQKSGNFGLNSNGKVIFRKFRLEIVEYLQRHSSFSVRNGTAGISIPFAKVSSFQSLISRKQLREIKLQMVSAISFGWFADFGKTLTIILVLCVTREKTVLSRHARWTKRKRDYS